MEYAQAQFDLGAVLVDEGKYEPALQSTKVLLPVFDRNLGPDDIPIVEGGCVIRDSRKGPAPSPAPVLVGISRFNTVWSHDPHGK